jgi:hypothetical protein
MATPAHDIGDQRRITGRFTDIAGDPADPSNVTLTIREPDGTIITKTGGEISNPTVGTYHFDHTIAAKPGRCVYRWEGAGAVIASGENEFWVRHRNALP